MFPPAEEVVHSIAFLRRWVADSLTDSKLSIRSRKNDIRDKDAQRTKKEEPAAPSSTQMFNFVECRRNSMVFLATTKEVLRDVPAGDRSHYDTDVLKNEMLCSKRCRIWPNKTSSIFTIYPFKSTSKRLILEVPQ